jgi:hypothetical protein
MQKPIEILTGGASRQGDYYSGFPTEAIGGKNWQPVLKEGAKMVDKYFKWQLGFGSLLGAVREDDHCVHHDIDLDIDVLITDRKEVEKIQEFKQSVIDRGYRFIRAQMYDGLTMSLLFVGPGNILLDYGFFYHFWGSDLLNVGIYGIVVRPEYALESTTIKIGDYDFYIPKEYDKYLTGRYGDWRTPKHSKGHWYNDAGKYFVPLDSR